MNNVNTKLHEFQKQILNKLSKVPNARFNDLLIENMESEHMNYHLKKLLDFGLVEKIDDRYKLTNNGKDYTNLMDDEINFIEKQPKTSVLINAVRKNSDGKVEQLVCRRLKHPYFGKVGRLTGKVRFGETLEQAVIRELYEETGLKAKTIILEKVFHKMRHSKNGEYLQDVIFYRFFIKDLSGKFIAKTPYQENLWISEEDIKNRQDLDFFDTVNLSFKFESEQLNFIEDDAEALDF